MGVGVIGVDVGTVVGSTVGGVGVGTFEVQAVANRKKRIVAKLFFTIRFTQIFDQSYLLAKKTAHGPYIIWCEI